ncbi:hypothetical protein POUND7_000441 [Theobroma cacao]
MHLGLLSSSLDEYATNAERDAYDLSRLGGKINPSLVDLKHLSFLDLSQNDFGGMQIPEFIGSLKSLTYLNLSGANFGEAIPHKLGKLSKLHYLDLGVNPLLQAKSLQWISGLPSLQYLDLSRVNLSKATDWLQVTNIPSLVELHLSDCNLNNDPSPVSVNYTSLAVLDLSESMLSSVPMSIFSLLSLVSMDLRSNSFGGPLPDGLQNMSSLKVLDLSQNSFNSSIPSWLSSLNHLQFLSLRDNNLEGEISSAIGNLSSVTYLDLSGNRVEGIVPKCLESLCKLRVMDLSSNKIDHEQSNKWKSSSEFRTTCEFRKFRRPLFDFLCNSSTKLQPTLLDIESNLLSGEIPDCWKNWQYLEVLKLGNNNLTGKIPRSLGSMHFIKSLNLRNNSLFGELPSALQHFADLMILDLSENQFTGSIPAWMGDKLSQLAVLNLRSNNFHGHIPDKICALHSLQILDLGFNSISGAIPKCLGNLSAMATKTLDQYVGYMPWLFGSIDSFFLDAWVVMKGREDKYSTILTLVTSIDLSANSLTGEIFKELGNLIGLRSLNLSGNLLTGKIPENIGNLELLESLDLSVNRLNGEIPLSFSNLNFLNHLNLSYNNLSGKIPSGTQLQSFDMFSYIGNHLCGPPVTKNCNAHGETPNVTNGGSSEGSDGPKVNGLYVSIMLGFVMGFWGVMGPLIFIRSWRFAYYQKLEDVGRKLYVFWATTRRSSFRTDLGNLIGLQSLNLSGNLLTGKIPEKIGNMESLESLDLSMNRLYGEFPSSFSDLHFLNHLNLSYNNLTGQIPSSTQLQSFEMFSYIGNHLCGPPVTKNCNANGVTHNVTNGGSSEASNGSKVNGLYVSIVLGFVMRFWGVVAPLFFIRSWRFAYYQKLDDVGRKLYVFWATTGRSSFGCVG